MLRSLAIFVLCSFPGALTITEEMQELANTLHNSCVEETGVSEDAIESVRKGNFPEDEKLKCYMKCLMEQMACIDDNGIIDLEAAIAILPEELQDVVEPVVRKCGTKIGANPCDNAFLTNKCWYQEAPQVYFLV